MVIAAVADLVCDRNLNRLPCRDSLNLNLMHSQLYMLNKETHGSRNGRARLELVRDRILQLRSQKYSPLHAQLSTISPQKTVKAALTVIPNNTPELAAKSMNLVGITLNIACQTLCTTLNPT